MPLAQDLRRTAFAVMLLLSWLPAARAQSEDEAGPRPCAPCCASRPAVPHPEPRLSRAQARLLGGISGLALGVALGRTSSPVGTPSSLTSLRRTDALLMGGAIALSFSPRLLEHDEPTRVAATPADCAAVAAGPNAFDRKLRGFALGDRGLEKRELLSRLSWVTLSAALAQPVASCFRGTRPTRGAVTFRSGAKWLRSRSRSIRS